MEILCYTRNPKEDIIYANRLAFSMHLAYKTADGKYHPFHHNEGILYARAVQYNNGTLKAKSLKNPWLFLTKDGNYGVIAVRTEAEGGDDPENEGCAILWNSRDLVHYQEIGPVRLQKTGYVQDVRCFYDKEKNSYRIDWLQSTGKWLSGYGDIFEEPEVTVYGDAGKENGGVPGEDTLESSFEGIEGIQARNSITVPDALGEYLLQKLLTPVCRNMVLSLTGPVKTLGELTGIMAIGVYSDDSEVIRKIDWQEENGLSTGRTMVEGMVHQEHFDFPFAEHRADPCCMYWKGKYYYIATNDADNNCSLYIRCSDTLSGIVAAKEELLLDTGMYPGIKGLLWAPEFHEIGRKLYIFHGATEGEFFWEESRVMALKEGGNPMNASDWSEPHLVVKKDGTPLCEAGKVISLDMTTFYYGGEPYAVWSQRQFLPVDQGAWLYIAKIDENEPWKLVSDPVCLIKPEYGWENNHTFVVEGPYALERNGQLMLTYSGAGIDTTYTVGLLVPVMESDILNPENWRKNNYPIMSSRSALGQYGPGHNSYLEDENGLVWNFYHARNGVEAPRSSGARRVHFDIDGEPMLDVTEEMDIPKELRRFFIEVGL
ncbi:family 43 glycosylhydrolase [Anaerocolumna jejuensis]|uniref:family 43 glycosylhydrolase n=1 Tax=Anaerocolumna jejuensis TaxID=259063 RepID=UPI003F7B3CA1